MVYLQRWHGWCNMKLLSAVSAQVPYHFMQSHIRKVHACLAVTCHLHFWQNDRDLLRATAVTRGWNGYRNRSRHKKVDPGEKILPPLLQGLEPATFQFYDFMFSTHTIERLRQRERKGEERERGVRGRGRGERGGRGKREGEREGE